MPTYETYSTSLTHHGIKGQKWGVRRFQNEDGTLTSAGKKRYNLVDSAKNAIASRKAKRDAYKSKMKAISENESLDKVTRDEAKYAASSQLVKLANDVIPPIAIVGSLKISAGDFKLRASDGKLIVAGILSSRAAHTAYAKTMSGYYKRDGKRRSNKLGSFMGESLATSNAALAAGTATFVGFAVADTMLGKAASKSSAKAQYRRDNNIVQEQDASGRVLRKFRPASKPRTTYRSGTMALARR